MNAKQRLIDFIQHTHGPCASKVYEFTVPGDEAAASAFVHRMRVELSRLRAVVRDTGKQPRRFKMRLEAITPVSETETRVRLLFHERGSVRLAHDVANIFGAVTTGAASATDNTSDTETAPTEPVVTLRAATPRAAIKLNTLLKGRHYEQTS